MTKLNEWEMGGRKNSPKLFELQSTCVQMKGMVRPDGQPHRVQQQKNEELNSTGKGLDLRVDRWVHQKIFFQGSSSQNMLGVVPFWHHRVKLKRPRKEHLPMYLWWMP